MHFSDLGLSDKVLSAVAGTGYTQPTPIQEQAIPRVLDRKDVLGIAQTGTGKTASFVLPMLSVLERGRAKARMPRTLIVEPTRELAAQVEDSFKRYGVNHKLTVALLIGGVSFGEQDRKIDRGADVVIATPGRLLDHFERGKLLLQGVEIVVIDEADRMLDMGFIPDVERIFKILPVTRQTLFFSATMPNEIQSLVTRFMPKAERVEVSPPTSAAETVTQWLVSAGTSAAEKRAVLRDEIKRAENLKNAMIFCNRKRDVGILHRSMARHGFSVGALHGDMDQRSRMATLDAFKNGEIKFLVASDVAARGLDIPDVSHVFNYDVPHHSEDYIHRIGRTGRAGRSGTAITIVTTDDAKSLAAIEKMLARSLEWRGKPVEDARPADAEDGRKRRRGGRTRGKGREKAPETAAEPATAGAPAKATPAPAVDERSAAPEKADPAPAAEEPRPVAEEAGSAGKAPNDGKALDEGRSRREDEKASARADRSADGAKGSGRSSRRRGKGDGERREDRESADVAFGETSFVPAFLLRPVRIKALEDEETESAASDAVATGDPASDPPEAEGNAPAPKRGRGRGERRSTRSNVKRSRGEAKEKAGEGAADPGNAETTGASSSDGDTDADADGEPALVL